MKTFRERIKRMSDGSYSFPLDAKVEWLAPRWLYLSVILNTDGRSCSLSSSDALKYKLPAHTDLNTLGVGGWELVSVWSMPGDMLRALLKRGVRE